MRSPVWLAPTARRLALPAVGVALFAAVVWKQWPLGLNAEDLGVLVWALFGLACVIGPDEVVSNLTLRGRGYTSFTASEARTFEDAHVVQLVGFVVLLDALLGVGKWLVWTWW